MQKTELKLNFFFLACLTAALILAPLITKQTVCLAKDSESAPEPPGIQDARKLFADKQSPAGKSSSIGEASCGCLSGAKQLPADGEHWQVMRLSRNRNWAHPSMISYIENLSRRANKAGWSGLLIGDLSMPRGGPMPSGHASHQRGTDADIWLLPAPARTLTKQERESMDAPSVLKLDSAELNYDIWSEKHANFVKAAAADENVARIFVTAAIKKELCNCKDANGADTAWLRRLRPWEGHDDHIHVRLKCPPGDPCVEQEAPPEGDGCGEELTEWLQKTALDPPHKSKPSQEKSEYKPFDLRRLPEQCRNLLELESNKP